MHRSPRFHDLAMYFAHYQPKFSHYGTQINVTVFLLKSEATNERRKQDCANLLPADWVKLQVVTFKNKLKNKSIVMYLPDQINACRA